MNILYTNFTSNTFQQMMSLLVKGESLGGKGMNYYLWEGESKTTSGTKTPFFTCGNQDTLPESSSMIPGVSVSI